MHKKADTDIFTRISIPGSENYTTYFMRGEQGGRFEYGVTMRDAGLAISLFLTKRCRELGIADTVRNDAYVAQAITAHNPHMTENNPLSNNSSARIQAQNARLIRDGMIESSFVGLRTEMIQNGYPMSKLEIQDTQITIGYSITGSNFTFEFPL